MIATLYDGHPEGDGVELTDARQLVELVGTLERVELGGAGYRYTTSARATHWAVLSPAGVLLFYWRLGQVADPGDTVTVAPGHVVAGAP